MTAAAVRCEEAFWHDGTTQCGMRAVGVHQDPETREEYPVCASHQRLRPDCPNPHGLDLLIKCWSPGGPCEIPNDPSCECCGECVYCAEVVR